MQESKSRPFLAKAALSCLSHLLFHLTYVIAFLQCMQAITRISIASFQAPKHFVKDRLELKRRIAAVWKVPS